MSGVGMFAIEDVERYITLSRAFMERCRTESVEAAKSHVYFGEAELPPEIQAGATLAPLRPFAILVPAEMAYDPMGIGDSIEYGTSGGIMAIFQDNPQYKENFKESLRDFYGWMTAVTDEITSMKRKDNYIRFRVRMVAPPYRPPYSSRESDDFWECGILFSYGDQ